jgi:hypothetical protein
MQPTQGSVCLPKVFRVLSGSVNQSFGRGMVLSERRIWSESEEGPANADEKGLDMAVVE